MECPCDFGRWDVILEAIEYSLLKRRELRVQVVRCIVYALMLRIAFLDGKVAKIATSVAHNILIRYPNIRVGLSFMTNSNAVEEDTAANRDYAMQGNSVHLYYPPYTSILSTLYTYTIHPIHLYYPPYPPILYYTIILYYTKE